MSEWEPWVVALAVGAVVWWASKQNRWIEPVPRRAAPATVTSPDTLKSLRESLCVGQTAILTSHPDDLQHVMVLQRLIDDIDRQRPLDQDGRHRRHTDVCGCEDR